MTFNRCAVLSEQFLHQTVETVHRLSFKQVYPKIQKMNHWKLNQLITSLVTKLSHLHVTYADAGLRDHISLGMFDQFQSLRLSIVPHRPIHICLRKSQTDTFGRQTWPSHLPSNGLANGAVRAPSQPFVDALLMKDLGRRTTPSLGPGGALTASNGAPRLARHMTTGKPPARHGQLKVLQTHLANQFLQNSKELQAVTSCCKKYVSKCL